jgi:CRP/FNR family transcriptional regulator
MRELTSHVDGAVHDCLSAFDFVDELGESGLESLVGKGTLCRFDVDTPLLSSGQGCEALLLVAKGGIRVYKQAPSGREILLYRVSRGETCVLGTTCMLRQSSYPAEAIALAGTVAVALPADLFRELFEAEPAVRRFVLDLYAVRLEELMLLIEEIAFRKMDERLATFLLRESQLSTGVYVPVNMTHEELATELGTVREVVSRLLHQFAEEGSVVLERGRVKIQDRKKLENFTETDE